MAEAGFTLTFLKLENFKSFSGEVTCNFIGKLTSIVGGNGIGKSNMLDGLAFALGCGMEHLRVQDLNDLICKSGRDQSPPNRSSVTIQFSLYGSAFEFKKCISGSEVSHFIDSEEVTHEEYNRALTTMHCGDVLEHFMSLSRPRLIMTPAEMTKWLERVSRSAEQAAVYDQATADQTRLYRLGEDLKTALDQRKEEVKMCDLDVESRKKLNQLREEMNNLRVKYFLFRLYHLERRINDLENEKRVARDTRDTKALEVEDIDRAMEDRVSWIELQQSKLDDKTANLEVESQTVFQRRLVVQERSGLWKYHRNRFEVAVQLLAFANSARLRQADARVQLLARIGRVTHDIERLVMPEEFNVRDMDVDHIQMQEYSRLSMLVSDVHRDDRARLEILLSERQTELQRMNNAESELCVMLDEVRALQLEAIRNARVLICMGFQYVPKTALIQMENDLAIQENAKRSDSTRRRKIREELQEIENHLMWSDLNENSENRSRWLDSVVTELRHAGFIVYGRIRDLYDFDDSSAFSAMVSDLLQPHLDTLVVDTRATMQGCVAFMETKHGEVTFMAVSEFNIEHLSNKLQTLRLGLTCSPLYDNLINMNDVAKAVFMHLTKDIVLVQGEEGLAQHKNLLMVSREDQSFLKSGSAVGPVSVDHIRRRRQPPDVDMANEWVNKKRLLLQKLEDLEAREITDAKLSALNRQVAMTRSERQPLALIEPSEGLDNEIAEKWIQIEGVQQQLTNAREELDNRDTRIAEIRAVISATEDEMFADFCEEIGVAHVHEFDGLGPTVYEWTSERARLDALLEKLELESNADRVDDWDDVVQQWQDNRDSIYEEFVRNIENVEADESRIFNEENDRILRLKELVNSMRNELERNKKVIANLEGNKAVVTSEVIIIEQRIVNIDNAILQKRASRHTCLIACKNEYELALPMLVGNMDDIQLRPVRYRQREAGEAVYFDENTIQVFDDESRFKFDYRYLDGDLKMMDSPEEIEDHEKRMIDELNKRLTVVRALSGSDLITAQNRRRSAMRQLTRIERSLDEFKDAKCSADKRWASVQLMRKEKFEPCLTYVSEKLGEIYKVLNDNMGADASLVSANENEPYLGETVFTTVLPNKFPRTVESLSTGERTMAALALFYAIISFLEWKRHEFPYLLLDEVGVNLDQGNVNKVAMYVKDASENGSQTILVSQTVKMDRHADALIGICRQNFPDDYREFQAITFDMSTYEI